MLHVAVHRDDRISVRMIDAAGQRELMSIVACEKNRANMCILRPQRAQNLTAAVR